MPLVLSVVANAFLQEWDRPLELSKMHVCTSERSGRSPEHLAIPYATKLFEICRYRGQCGLAGGQSQRLAIDVLAKPDDVEQGTDAERKCIWTFDLSKHVFDVRGHPAMRIGKSSDASGACEVRSLKRCLHCFEATNQRSKIVTELFPVRATTTVLRAVSHLDVRDEFAKCALTLHNGTECARTNHARNDASRVQSRVEFARRNRNETRCANVLLVGWRRDDAKRSSCGKCGERPRLLRDTTHGVNHLVP
jgi:hypothetical protein